MCNYLTLRYCYIFSKLCNSLMFREITIFQKLCYPLTLPHDLIIQYIKNERDLVIRFLLLNFQDWIISNVSTLLLKKEKKIGLYQVWKMGAPTMLQDLDAGPAQQLHRICGQFNTHLHRHFGRFTHFTTLYFTYRFRNLYFFQF